MRSWIAFTGLLCLVGSVMTATTLSPIALMAELQKYKANAIVLANGVVQAGKNRAANEDVATAVNRYLQGQLDGFRSNSTTPAPAPKPAGGATTINPLLAIAQNAKDLVQKAVDKFKDAQAAAASQTTSAGGVSGDEAQLAAAQKMAASFFQSKGGNVLALMQWWAANQKTATIQDILDKFPTFFPADQQQSIEDLIGKATAANERFLEHLEEVFQNMSALAQQVVPILLNRQQTVDQLKTNLKAAADQYSKDTTLPAQAAARVVVLNDVLPKIHALMAGTNQPAVADEPEFSIQIEPEEAPQTAKEAKQAKKAAKKAAKQAKKAAKKAAAN